MNRNIFFLLLVAILTYSPLYRSKDLSMGG
jgi:hypothetical protein